MADTTIAQCYKLKIHRLEHDSSAYGVYHLQTWKITGYTRGKDHILITICLSDTHISIQLF